MARATGGLEIRLKLDEDDLALLRERLLHALTLGEHESEESLVRTALGASTRAQQAHVPSYVRKQVGLLEDLAAMLDDSEWTVPRSARDRVRLVLCYFLDSEDLIPDEVPLFGLLDDAIMIDLLARELADELDAHRAFRQFRERLDARLGPEPDAAAREREIGRKRRALRSRVQERRRKAKPAGARERWFRSVLRLSRS